MWSESELPPQISLTKIKTLPNTHQAKKWTLRRLSPPTYYSCLGLSCLVQHRHCRYDCIVWECQIPLKQGGKDTLRPPKKCDKEKTFWGMKTIKYLSNFCLPQNNKQMAQRGLKTILFSGRLLHRPREQDLLQLLRVRQGHDRTGRNIEKCKCRNFNMSTKIIIFLNHLRRTWATSCSASSPTSLSTWT